MEPKQKTPAEIFREAREGKGVSQQKVGDHIGVTRAQISHYECGIDFPPFSKLVKYCAFLDIDLQDVAEAAA